MNLSKRVKVTPVLGYYAAAQTTRKATTIIDMAGFEGCLFMFNFGTILETAVISALIYGDAANSTSAMVQLLGQTTYTVTATSAGYNPSCILVDVWQPDPVLHRYLEAQIQLATANVVILGINAIQYQGRIHPDTNPATVLKSTFLRSVLE